MVLRASRGSTRVRKTVAKPIPDIRSANMERNNLKFWAIIALLGPLIVTWFLLADPVPGVPVNGPIVPFDDRDTYSTLDPWWAPGVFRDAPNPANRDAIPPLRRTRGMIVYTSSDGKYWVLGNDLVTWNEASFSGGGVTNNIYNRDGILTSDRTMFIGANQRMLFDASGGVF